MAHGGRRYSSQIPLVLIGFPILRGLLAPLWGSDLSTSSLCGLCAAAIDGGRATGFTVGLATQEVLAFLQPDVAADVGERMSRWFRVALIDIFEKLVVERTHGLWDGFGLNPEHHAYLA